MCSSSADGWPTSSAARGACGAAITGGTATGRGSSQLDLARDGGGLSGLVGGDDLRGQLACVAATQRRARLARELELEGQAAGRRDLPGVLGQRRLARLDRHADPDGAVERQRAEA